MGDRLEAVFAPAALKCTKLMATADWCALLCAIRVKDDIVGRMLGKLSLAAHGGDESAGAGFRRAQVRGVHEDQPLCQGRAELNTDNLVGKHHNIADFEGDTPGNALSAWRVLQCPRHFLRDSDIS